jgi:molybdopterin synthase sulfur carrier subunit
VRINLYAVLREIAGVKTIEIPIKKETTVAFALQELVNVFSSLHEEVWAGDNQLTDRITVILNGRDIRHLEGLKTNITDFDQLDVFPPVGGGSGQDQVRKVTLRFLGDFHFRVPQAEVEFSFKGDLLRELILAVIEEFAVEDLFLENEAYKPYLRVFIDGRISHLIGGFEAVIPENATVAFSMIGGVQNAAGLPEGTRFFELKNEDVNR